MSKLQERGIDPDLCLSDQSFMVLDRKFHFWTDLAATSKNSKCQHFISPERNFFFTDLPDQGNLYLHPPYQLGTELWLYLLERHVRKTKQLALVLLPWDEEAFWYKEYSERLDVIIQPAVDLVFNKKVDEPYVFLIFNLSR